jgi:hypothetical protein
MERATRPAMPRLALAADEERSQERPIQTNDRFRIAEAEEQPQIKPSAASVASRRDRVRHEASVHSTAGQKAKAGVSGSVAFH